MALTSKDFSSDQDVKWCPGCGDYSILKQVQTVLPQIGVDKENIVFISGIGCSSRFPYYMETYGMHGIHGRAPAIASGVKIANPKLSVWVITGDGDALSIGGNHFIHLLRRNSDINILLFNNEIYGLTKGQFSPTSKLNLKTKSSPFGSIMHSVNPAGLALGADATFVARAIDRNPKHLREMLLRSHSHKGTSFLEIFQNCLVFNDGAFGEMTDKETKDDRVVYLENGKPLVFGKQSEKTIIIDSDLLPKIVNLDNCDKDKLWIHDEKNKTKANILANLSGEFPKPVGVLYCNNRSTFEDDLVNQKNEIIKDRGVGDIQKLLKGKDFWEVK